MPFGMIISAVSTFSREWQHDKAFTNYCVASRESQYLLGNDAAGQKTRPRCLDEKLRRGRQRVPDGVRKTE